MFMRATSLADAFVTAAVKRQKAAKKVGQMIDPGAGKGDWKTRRVLLNCERAGFAVVKERDSRPQKPSKVLPLYVQQAIVDGIGEIAEKLVMGRKVELMDEEILGVQ